MEVSVFNPKPKVNTFAKTEVNVRFLSLYVFLSLFFFRFFFIFPRTSEAEKIDGTVPKNVLYVSRDCGGTYGDWSEGANTGWTSETYLVPHAILVKKISGPPCKT